MTHLSKRRITMRILPKLISLGIFLVFYLVAITSKSGELIEPTRTLQSSRVANGKISVYSEPDGLDVFLDNLKIGETPIVSLNIEPGSHNLKVKDLEKEIFIMPDKSLRITLYKGNFIEIPEKEREIPQQLEKNITEKRKTTEPTPKKTGYKPVYEPFYWPMNPSGPIEVKPNDE
jgi:hypothetical protein